jgi:adenylate kinase
MRTALTGVPGTGKSTIARRLAEHGLRVVDLNAFAKEHGLLKERDEARGSFVIDMDDLADALRDEAFDVVEGHFSHEMDVDAIALLRCDPLVLVERLRARGWSDAKVRENVEAEALDVLAAEVQEVGLPSWELDATHVSVDDAARVVRSLVDGQPEALKAQRVGTARWPLESLPWF